MSAEAGRLEALAEKAALRKRATADRDAKVLRYAREGLTDTEIAGMLGVSRSRVTALRLDAGIPAGRGAL